MSRKHLGIVVVLAVVLAAVGGAQTRRWVNRHTQPAPLNPEPPVLTIDSHHLDFGEVWETDQFELLLPIRNTSSASIHLTEWQNSCNCLGVEPPSFRFGPHEEKWIKIKLDIASKLRMNPTTAQAVAVNFAGVLSDGKTVAWQIRGVVKPVVKVYPDLSFSPQSELTQPYAVKQVVLEFAEPVSITSLESDSPFVTATCKGTATSPQTRCSVELQFAPTIPVGEHRFTLNVQGAIQSPRQQIVKQLGGVLRVASDVQCDPGQVIFPAKAVGDEGEETVVVKSLTGHAVHIESVMVEGEGLTADWGKGESKLVVRQRSTKTGQMTTRVRVIARSEGRSYDVALPVTSLWINP